MTIGEALSGALRDRGEYPCLLEVDQMQGISATSAQEFQRRIADCAAQLQAWGVQRGHFVPLFLNNSADFITAFLALLQIRAVPVLAKMECRRIELDEIFRNAQPEAIITERHHLPFLRQYLKNTVVIARKRGLLSPVQSADGSAARDDLPSELASINYTYRGYGYPLGAMVTHAQYLHGARVLQDGLQGNKGERMLTILPMVHIFTLVGCILAPLLYGMTCVIAGLLHPRRLLECIGQLGIDYIASIPQILSLLARIRDPSTDSSSLKAFVSGGSLLTPEDFAEIKEAFSIDLLHGYGLTEFTPVSRNIRGRARPGTVGPVCSGVACRIDSTTSNGIGEILINAPQIGGSYYNRPQESHEAHRDGWFRTGDLGRFDQDHLVFVAELKNTRKINGNIVDLEEVSRAIRQDPDVSELQVSWEGGELVAHLGFSGKENFEDKVRQLKMYLRNTIAEYKIPKRMGAL